MPRKGGVDRWQREAGDGAGRETRVRWLPGNLAWAVPPGLPRVPPCAGRLSPKKQENGGEFHSSDFGSSGYPKAADEGESGPSPGLADIEDVVQTETLPQTLQSAHSTSRLFSSTISGKNTLMS